MLPPGPPRTDLSASCPAPSLDPTLSSLRHPQLLGLKPGWFYISPQPAKGIQVSCLSFLSLTLGTSCWWPRPPSLRAGDTQGRQLPQVRAQEGPCQLMQAAPSRPPGSPGLNVQHRLSSQTGCLSPDAQAWASPCSGAAVGPASQCGSLPLPAGTVTVTVTVTGSCRGMRASQTPMTRKGEILLGRMLGYLFFSLFSSLLACSKAPCMCPDGKAWKKGQS